ncbi:hypothetical protein NM208_g7255 [Fusarium decemcellulare]|uniref:Uncharacterized protein n=1 Tax=Fusarium decemcellulare TaxID=57161 RepID=A0ACC1SA45_9HYPO|nr:hypothetical protein NM208_g7255 [Fusarium decemcellulare]
MSQSCHQRQHPPSQPNTTFRLYKTSEAIQKHISKPDFESTPLQLHRKEEKSHALLLRSIHVRGMDVTLPLQLINNAAVAQNNLLMSGSYNGTEMSPAAETTVAICMWITLVICGIALLGLIVFMLWVMISDTISERRKRKNRERDEIQLESNITRPSNVASRW